MRPLKKRIRQYMLRTTATLMIVFLFVVMWVQVVVERNREYEKSFGVLKQIEKFVVENIIAEDTEQSEYSNLFSLIKVNSDADYYVFEESSGKVLGATVRDTIGSSCEELGLRMSKMQKSTKGFYAKINGHWFFCVFLKVGDEYVGRCTSCSNMYQRVPTTTLVFCLCLTSIVCVLTYIVSRYMNRYVVDGIHEINDKLYKIAEGDMETKVDIRTSEEFSELSDYINTMVGSLSDTTSKISYVLSKTNMFIGVYEYRKGAKPVRCTEYIPRIFSLELDEWRVLTSDYELFNDFIEKIRLNPYSEEQGVFLLSEEPEQYVKLEEIEIGNEVFGVVIDVTDEVIKRRQIEAERDVDLLTGLYNRRGMDTQIWSLFRKQEELGFAALVMIDADGLKGINDIYGHEMGDVYLKKIAKVIQNFGIRSSLAARFGGDEFVLFLYEYDSEEELLNTIRTLEYVQTTGTARLKEGLTVPLRFSMGYCMTTEGANYDMLMKIADERMYANKRERKQQLAEEVR